MDEIHNHYWIRFASGKEAVIALRADGRYYQCGDVFPVDMESVTLIGRCERQLGIYESGEERNV